MARTVNQVRGGWDAPVGRSTDTGWMIPVGGPIPMVVPLPLLGAGVGAVVGVTFGPRRYRWAAGLLGAALGWGAGQVAARPMGGAGGDDA